MFEDFVTIIVYAIAAGVGLGIIVFCIGTAAAIANKLFNVFSL